MISTRQIKAARAMLAWSQADLARASGVSEPTIARREAVEGEIGGREGTAEKIRKALESAGVEFTNGDQPGVRLTKDAAAHYREPASASKPTAATKAITEKKR